MDQIPLWWYVSQPIKLFVLSIGCRTRTAPPILRHPTTRLAQARLSHPPRSNPSSMQPVDYDTSTEENQEPGLEHGSHEVRFLYCH